MSRFKAAWIMLGAAFCLVASQAAIAPSLGGLLRRNLARQAATYDSLDVKVAPLGWYDLLRGRLGRVEIKARQVTFGGPRLAALDMYLEGIEFAPGKLVLQGEAVVERLGPSRVRAKVESDALNEYRRRAYPAVPAFFQIRRDRVGLQGSLDLLGQTVTFRTNGRLEVEGVDRLRYIPTEIEVAGSRVQGSWLAAYGERLALEFPLVLPLPLALRQVKLGDGFAELTWTDSSPESVVEN
ncbi:MAG: LmeA family phospholipid-binding protein [Bacteroidota bacterium]